MDVTLHIPPEVEQELLAQARSQGVSLETVLEQLVRRHAMYGAGTSATTSAKAAPADTEIGPRRKRREIPPSPGDRLAPEEWIREFRSWARSHTSDAPLLSDEAINREFIYRERGL
jgi:hypothetical protein